MARLSDLGVLITGGAGGLGEAIARRLLAEGAQAVIADPRLEAASAQASILGERCHAVHLDVRDPDSWANAVDEASKLVDLAGLVNNADRYWAGALVEMPIDDLRDLIDTNLVGALLGTRAITPVLARNGGGAIVNIASVGSVRAAPATAAYAAAAWGVRGLTRSSSLELGQLGIRVNTVCPSIGVADLTTGGADGREAHISQHRPESALTDDGRTRRVTPGDVAAMVCFLLSDDSATCTGADFVVDAGWSAADGLAG